MSLPRLPLPFKDLLGLARSLDARRLRSDLERDLARRVCLVGPVGSGKSTLVDLLRSGSRERPLSILSGSPPTDLKGSEIFEIIDTPATEGQNGDTIKLGVDAAREAAVVVLVLDATGPPRQRDYGLWRALRLNGRPLIVALNKRDLLTSREAEAAVDEWSALLGESVLALSARTGKGVGQLLRAVIQADQRLAPAIGRGLPAVRRRVALGAVRMAALSAAFAGAEPLPMAGLPALLATQTGLVVRLAALYGQPLETSLVAELAVAASACWLLRQTARGIARQLPLIGWLAGAVLAAAGTLLLGRLAVAYFENGKVLEWQPTDRATLSVAESPQ